MSGVSAPLRELLINPKTGRLTPVWERFFTRSVAPAIDKIFNGNVETIPTGFQDKSVPFVDDGFLSEDNASFNYDKDSNELYIDFIESLIGDITELFSEIVNAHSLRMNTANAQSYLAGQISYDPVTKTNLSDTGLTGVRVNIGQETHFRIHNDTGVDWVNGAVVTSNGGVTADVVNGELADADTLSGRRVGMVTAPILDGEWGVATITGEVRGLDTSAFILDDSVYVSDVPGGLTTDVLLYPKQRVLVGRVLKVDAVDGIIVVYPYDLLRLDKSRSYSFTSNGILSGTYYVGGNYESSATDTTLTQASLTQTFGAALVPHGAHAFAVFGGSGTVDTGQVGLRVNGDSFNDDGVMVIGDTETLTDDITNILLDEYLETDKKWLGTVEYELYIVSGAPTAYTIDFNYGLAKYEDFNNIDFSVTGFEVVGLAGANDTNFNINVLHHSATGWIYSAAAFVPGNGIIISWDDDMAPNVNLINNDNFAYKRSNLAYYVEGSANEGVIVEITCGANGSVQELNAHLSAFSEGLPF